MPDDANNPVPPQPEAVYFKLAKWDPHTLCFRDGKHRHATEGEAIGAARNSGRYRVSEVRGGKRYDRAPFEVGGPDGPVIRPPVPGTYPNHATRPMGGRPH